jgi:hypothetical protein
MRTEIGRQMMELGKSNVVISAAASDTGTDSQDTSDRGGRPEDSGTDASGAGGQQPPEEAVSISGIAADDFSPEVKRAICPLSGEIERLRRELDWIKGREAKLVRLADAHSTIPILRRRAFVRELGRVLDHVG